MYRVTMTGATGFIGQHVLDAAIEQGWDITVLGRRVPRSKVKFIEWDLATRNGGVRDLACDALIHIAADMRPEWNTISEAEEIARGRELFDAVPETTRIVFLSSQASKPDAPTRYGRVKYQIEQLVHERGGIVIRPGLVYSANRGKDLHSRLRSLLCKLPIIPDLRPAPIVQPIHVVDLSRAIVRAASGAVPSGMYCVAPPDDLSFTEYLKLTARLQLGLWRPAVSVPRALVMATLPVVIPILRLLPLNVDPTSIKSLLSSRHMDTAADLDVLSVEIRPFRDGLRPANNAIVREVIMEGWALMSYLMGRAPPANLVKRYVLAIRQQPRRQPLRLRMLLVYCPRLIRLSEGKNLLSTWRDDDLERRLDIATRILESSVVGAGMFLQTRPVSRSGALLRMGWFVAIDGLWQLIACVLRLRVCDDA